MLKAGVSFVKTFAHSKQRRICAFRSYCAADMRRQAARVRLEIPEQALLCLQVLLVEHLQQKTLHGRTKR